MHRRIIPPPRPHPAHHHLRARPSTGTLGAVALGLGGAALLTGALGASLGGLVSPLLFSALVAGFLALALTGEADTAPPSVVRMRPTVFVVATIAGVAAAVYAATTVLTVLVLTGPT
jgi:hypothetical protein